MGTHAHALPHAVSPSHHTTTHIASIQHPMASAMLKLPTPQKTTLPTKDDETGAYNMFHNFEAFGDTCGNILALCVLLSAAKEATLQSFLHFMLQPLQHRRALPMTALQSMQHHITSPRSESETLQTEQSNTTRNHIFNSFARACSIHSSNAFPLLLFTTCNITSLPNHKYHKHDLTTWCCIF